MVEFETLESKEIKLGKGLLIVATSEEAEQLILQGWKFVGTLPNSKVVLEK